MVRSDIVRAVSAADPQLSAGEANRIVEVSFEQMIAHLATGARIELRGFGMFSTRARLGREARNPRTGERVDVKAKRAVHFRAGKELRERIDASKPLRR